MKDVTTEMIPFASLAPLRLRVSIENEKDEKDEKDARARKNEKRSLCRCRV